MMVYTCTEISAGKELCVRYIDTRGTFSYRQYMLQDGQPVSEEHPSCASCFWPTRWILSYSITALGYLGSLKLLSAMTLF